MKCPHNADMSSLWLQLYSSLAGDWDKLELAVKEFEENHREHEETR